MMTLKVITRLKSIKIMTHTAGKVSVFGVILYSSPRFPAFGLNTERYSLHTQPECEKIRTTITSNNSNTFCAVAVSNIYLLVICIQLFSK